MQDAHRTPEVSESPKLTPPTPTLAPIDRDSPTIANPWSDAADSSAEKEPLKEKERELHTPDLSTLDSTIASGLESLSVSTDSEKQIPVSKDVLNEFDPLANSVEQLAKAAWETAEAHPPPPTKTPPPEEHPPAPPVKDLLVSPPDSPQSALSPSTFPSFSSFAKSFSIPGLGKPRPLSLDVAKPVPSPATLSALATQQEQGLKTPEQASRAATPTSSSAPPTAEAGSTSPAPEHKQDGEIPFDFQKFLDQMKSRNAEPVSKYLRSFLSNFAKRTFTVNDQIKIINDFLNFIAEQMRSCDVWRNASDAEFDNAMEGMEKLVMNRLYDFTFTPQVVNAVPPRPITTDDLERDRILSQRIALFGWIQEKHLDIPEQEEGSGFMMFAEQELLKVNHYKAPRDKLICILNCCKVIYGMLRHLKIEEGADSFLPILIFVVLKANPDHLLSNVEFINRFRNPAKLQSEAGYYLSSLMGAVSFIETMDHTSLSNISQEEFEKNVEDAIQTLPLSDPSSPLLRHSVVDIHGIVQPMSPQRAGEESAQPLSLPTPTQTISEDAKRLLQKTGDTISKPLNAISRIFTEALDGALDGAEEKLSYLPGPFAPFELGREQRNQAGASNSPAAPRWSYPDGVTSPQSANSLQSPIGNAPYTPQSAEGGQAGFQTPYKPRVRRVPSPSYPSPGYGFEETPSRPRSAHQQSLSVPHPSQPPPLPPRVQTLAAEHAGGSISRTPTPGLDLAGIEAQIDAATEHAAAASKDTLRQIFPAVDSEIIDWVLEAQEGDLGKSIEALLEMSSGS